MSKVLLATSIGAWLFAQHTDLGQAWFTVVYAYLDIINFTILR